MILPKTYLTEAIDDKSILRILTQSKSIDTSDPNYNHYKKLADWAKHRQLKIKNVSLDDIELSDRSLIGKQLNSRYNSLGSLLDTLKNLMDQKGRYGIDADASKLIQQTTLEILDGLKIKEEAGRQTKPEESSSESEDSENSKDSELYEGMDWTAEKARRLTKARETNEPVSEVLDKFYADYYLIEYASGSDEDIVSKLKNLDKILIPEFTALGYNPSVNPLAQFLKLLIKNKREIFNKLTTNIYGAIHNSFISKAITGNELGNYPADIKTENILFCNDLYNHNGLDIVEYLQLQKQFRDAAKGTDYAADPKFIAKAFIQQKALDAKNYTNNIDLLFKKETQATGTLPDNAKLKSLNEIRELYKYLFKANANKLVNINEIINSVKRRNIVLDMIRYILDQDDFKKAYTTEAKEMKAQLTKAGFKRNDNNIDDCEEILLEYELDVQSKYQIFAKLIAAHNEEVKAKKARG